MAALIGSIGEFEEDLEDFETYIARLEQFFKANKVESDLQAATFLTVMGRKCFHLLQDLLSPIKPSASSYSVLVDTLKKHYKPKKIIIFERFQFYSCAQKEGESIKQFVANLKSFAHTCDFGVFLKDMLRDRFVMGLQNPKTQKLLLTKDDLTIEEAIEIAVAHEAADKDVLEMGAASATTSSSTGGDLFYVKGPAPSRRGGSSSRFQRGYGYGFTNSPNTPCSSCGGLHWKRECPYKNFDCRACGQIGHLQKVCQNTSANSQTLRKTFVTNAKATNYSTQPADRGEGSANASVHNADEYTIHGIHEIGEFFSKPYVVNLLLNGVVVPMEVDTGASRTLMSKSSKYVAIFSNSKKISPSKVNLSKYGGTAMSVCGETIVSVSWKPSDSSQRISKNLVLIIVEEEGPNLLGRDWLQALNFQVESMIPKSLMLNSVETTDYTNLLRELLDTFTRLFLDEVGTYTGAKVHVAVEKDVPAKFCKHRPVPYILREKIDDELDRLLREKIIEPVKYAKWACPIVPVMKPNGSIRICGDYNS